MKDHVCPECSSHNTINVEDACRFGCFETWENEQRKVGQHTERSRYDVKGKDGNYYPQYYTVNDYRTFRVPYLLVSSLVLDEETKPPERPPAGDQEKLFISNIGCLTEFIFPIFLGASMYYFPEKFYPLERALDISEGYFFVGAILSLIVLLVVFFHVLVHVFGVGLIPEKVVQSKAQEEYKKWKRKYICMRCGHVFEDTEMSP